MAPTMALVVVMWIEWKMENRYPLDWQKRFAVGMAAAAEERVDISDKASAG